MFACVSVRRYFERQLLPLYHEKITVGPHFNKCESENHVLKQAVQQLSELIEYIRRLVEDQYTDADLIICGLGDLVLRQNNAGPQVAPNDYVN